MFEVFSCAVGSDTVVKLEEYRDAQKFLAFVTNWQKAHPQKGDVLWVSVSGTGDVRIIGWLEKCPSCVARISFMSDIFRVFRGVRIKGYNRSYKDECQEGRTLVYHRRTQRNRRTHEQLHRKAPFQSPTFRQGPIEEHPTAACSSLAPSPVLRVAPSPIDEQDDADGEFCLSRQVQCPNTHDARLHSPEPDIPLTDEERDLLLGNSLGDLFKEREQLKKLIDTRESFIEQSIRQAGNTVEGRLARVSAEVSEVKIGALKVILGKELLGKIIHFVGRKFLEDLVTDKLLNPLSQIQNRMAIAADLTRMSPAKDPQNERERRLEKVLPALSGGILTLASGALAPDLLKTIKTAFERECPFEVDADKILNRDELIKNLASVEGLRRFYPYITGLTFSDNLKHLQRKFDQLCELQAAIQERDPQIEELDEIKQLISLRQGLACKLEETNSRIARKLAETPLEVLQVLLGQLYVPHLQSYLEYVVGPSEDLEARKYPIEESGAEKLPQLYPNLASRISELLAYFSLSASPPKRLKTLVMDGSQELAR